METITSQEIFDALAIVGSSLSRNCIPVLLNFTFWFGGIIIFYLSLKKIRNNNSINACVQNSRSSRYRNCAHFNEEYLNKTKKSFELIKKSEWIYFYILIILTFFLGVVEAIFNEIPKTAIPNSSITVYNVVYMLLSITMPQISRLNTYIQFNLTLK